MARKLSEETKARMAARRIEKKHAKELGPLFEAQTPVIDERRLMLERRMGFSALVEHGHTLYSSPALCWLHESEYRSLVVLARQCLSAEDVEAIDSYVTKTYPDVVYRLSVWLRILCGKKRVAMRWEKVADPSVTLGYRVVEADVLPREGWQAPFGEDWHRTYFWQKCDRCKQWHAPGQIECYADAVTTDASFLVDLFSASD